MMMIIGLFSTASALTCQGGDLTCEAVLQMTTIANAEFAGTPVSDGAPARLRPQTFLDRLNQALDVLNAGGCTTTDEVQGFLAGRYGQGLVTGADDGGPLTGGTMSTSSRVFGATLSDSTEFGTPNFFSTYESNARFVAERDDDGFVVGAFARVQGANGVFMAVTGTCDGPADPEIALRTFADVTDWHPYDFGVPGGVQLDRLGMPAVNTALITTPNKDSYNASTPADDAALTFAGDIIALEDAYHGALDDDLTGLSLTPCTVDPGDPFNPVTSSCIVQGAPLVVPDTLQLDLTAPSGFPNGRRLTDPVMDVTLAVVLLDLNVHSPFLLASLPLNPPANDVPFSGTFPFLAPPQP